jgi:hypothetical protein
MKNKKEKFANLLIVLFCLWTLVGWLFWLSYETQSKHHRFNGYSYYEYKLYKIDIPLAVVCGPVAIITELAFQVTSLGEYMGETHRGY